MKSAILTVGTEILFGSILNTNAQYLSEQLRLIGHDVMYHFTVGDNPGRLKDLLAYAYHDCDLVITTGGLGPTEDDLTKEMIASYFGETIVEFPEQTKILKEHFEKRHSVFTENNLKQACFPEHAQILENPNGTAPGFLLEKDGKMIVSMPGPPREMKPMFENLVKPELVRRADAVIYYRNLRTTEIGESRLETELMDLIDGYPDPKIAYIGFFMMDIRFQGRQLGSALIREVKDYLKRAGFSAVRLAIDKANPQSNHFWKKNGFEVIREVPRDEWTVLEAECTL